MILKQKRRREKDVDDDKAEAEEVYEAYLAAVSFTGSMRIASLVCGHARR